MIVTIISVATTAVVLVILVVFVTIQMIRRKRKGTGQIAQQNQPPCANNGANLPASDPVIENLRKPKLGNIGQLPKARATVDGSLRPHRNASSPSLTAKKSETLPRWGETKKSDENSIAKNYSV